MTREEVKELLPIFKAYSEGKVIQELTLAVGDDWHDVDNLHEVDMSLYRYRIKPELKYRPFANAEECWQEMRKHQPFAWVKCQGQYRQVVRLVDGIFQLDKANAPCDFDEGKRFMTFADGTPFGVQVEDTDD